MSKWTEISHGVSKETKFYLLWSHTWPILPPGVMILTNLILWCVRYLPCVFELICLSNFMQKISKEFSYINTCKNGFFYSLLWLTFTWQKVSYWKLKLPYPKICFENFCFQHNYAKINDTYGINISCALLIICLPIIMTASCWANSMRHPPLLHCKIKI
jgi:hypothetical protein